MKNTEHKEKMLNAMKAISEMNVSKVVNALEKKTKGEDKKITISDLLKSEKSTSFFAECEKRGLKLKDAKAQFCEIIGVEITQATLKKVMNELGIYVNKAASQQSKGREEERDKGEVEEEDQSDFNVNVEIENMPSSFSIAHEHQNFESDIR